MALSPPPTLDTSVPQLLGSCQSQADQARASELPSLCLLPARSLQGMRWEEEKDPELLVCLLPQLTSG